MILESVKSLCEKAGIKPASNEMPEQPRMPVEPGPESYVLHDMSLRHVRIVLDPDCRPTQNNSLWYDGHLGWYGGGAAKKDGAFSMLVTEAELERHKERLFCFTHETIAAFNIAQIETGLAVIAYLKERTHTQADPAIAITSKKDFHNGARVIVLADTAAVPPAQPAPKSSIRATSGALVL